MIFDKVLNPSNADFKNLIAFAVAIRESIVQTNRLRKGGWSKF